MTRPPNLVLFNPETIRADAVLGDPAGRAATPTLDRMAAQGHAFSRCYCQSPYCSPSRVSMFTGLYPHTMGHRSLMHLIHANERNLFRDLKDAGYHTAVFGKNDLLAQESIPLSFDEFQMRVSPRHAWHGAGPGPESKWHDTFYHGRREAPCEDFDWACIQSALSFLAQPHDKPFCLFLPIVFAHPPYTVEEPWFSLHDRAKVKAPIPRRAGPGRGYVDLLRRARRGEHLTEADLREVRAVYYGMISRVDAQLQMLLDALDRHGLSDNTAVVYFSDHGDYAGDYGLVEKFHAGSEEGLIRVPMVIRLPASMRPAAGGATSDALVEMTDLYATVMEIAGVQPSHYHFSRSVMPLLRGERAGHRDAIFVEGGCHGDEKQFLPPIPPGSPYEASVKVMRENMKMFSRAVVVRTEAYKYAYCPGDRDELYDVRADPDELHNLADDPAHTPTVAAMRERLLRWMVDTGDVLPMAQDPRGWQPGR